MLVNVEISAKEIEVFREVLDTVNQEQESIYSHPAVVNAVIKHYLKNSIKRDDLGSLVSYYVDFIESSGELDDLVYECNL